MECKEVWSTLAITALQINYFKMKLNDKIHIKNRVIQIIFIREYVLEYIFQRITNGNISSLTQKYLRDNFINIWLSRDKIFDFFCPKRSILI